MRSHFSKCCLLHSLLTSRLPCATDASSLQVIVETRLYCVEFLDGRDLVIHARQKPLLIPFWLPSKVECIDCYKFSPLIFVRDVLNFRALTYLAVPIGLTYARGQPRYSAAISSLGQNFARGSSTRPRACRLSASPCAMLHAGAR